MGNFSIGLAVLGVGVLGSWLLGPKSKSTGSVPAGIPDLNQSMRGSAVPITFGTNRVSPQIVWTNNFKAVRQKSSGKGAAKGGGSGGFGSAKGGASAGQMYLYSWDLMYNFGMVDLPSVMRRAWIGGDNLDQKTVAQITGGLSSSVITQFPIESNIADKETATLEFQEAFFAPGYGTSDEALDNWSFFQSVTGEPCAFPNNLYIGFEQLMLGNAPTVPQMTAEIVPISTGFDFDTHLVWFDTDTNQSDDMENQGFLEADDDLYALYVNSGDVTVRRFSDGTTNTDLTAEVARTDIDAHYVKPYNFRQFSGVLLCPGTPYFYYIWQSTVLGFATIIQMQALLYKIVDGVPTLVGGHEGGYGPGTIPTRHDIANVSANGTDVDGNIWAFYSGSSIDFATYLAFLPNPVGVEGNYSLDEEGNQQENATTEFTTQGDYFLNGGGSEDRKAFARNNGEWFLYVTKSRIATEIANHGHSGANDYIYGLISTYPDGMMIGASGINNFFKNYDGSPFFPAPDVGNDSTGTPQTYTNANDYGAPYKSGDYYVIARGYSDMPNLVRVVVFDADGNQLFDHVGDVGGDLDINVSYVYVANNGDVYLKLWSDASNHRIVQFGTLGGAARDVTPAYIIYRILTSDVYGFATQSLFGFTPSADRIDQESYQAAVSYCAAQGIKISVTYTDQNDLLQLLNDLLSLYGGFLTDNDGMIQFGFVTADDVPVRTIDNHHLVVDKGKPPVQVTKAALEDGYNKVQFNYFDRKLDYKQAQVEASDEVDMDINGPRIKTFQAQYVMTGSTAQMIATRALWQNLYGNDQYAYKLGWKDADLKPGALVTLVDSFDATLRHGVLARILKWQENSRGKFDVTAVQQRPYIISASTDYTDTASIASGFGSLIQPPQPPLHQTAYELPLEFQGAKSYVYFGYASGMSAMGAQLYLSTDGANYVLTQDAQPFIISGAFARPLEKRHQNYVEDQVEFYLFPTSPFDIATPTFVQTYELDDVSAALRAQGAGTFIVGSEAVSYEGLTLLGQNHYKARRLFRGWGGTPISAHNSGEWFHQHAAGIFNHEISVDDVGNKFSYKIVPYNFVGKGYDISSIDAQSYQILGEYWLPRAMSRLHVFVDSGLTATGSTPVHGNVAVFGGESPVTLKWSDSANHDGFGAGGYGAGAYGHYAPDAPPPQFYVNVQSSNGTLVSSFVVSTGFFNYTVSQNATDWGSFQPDLVFNVQPFNAKGVGPTSATRSLMMF